MNEPASFDYERSVSKMRKLISEGAIEAMRNYRKHLRRMRKAKLYFIQAGSAGPIKIGIADDVTVRLKQLQTGNHEELHVVKIIENASLGTESEIHERLRRFHIRDEWFSCEVLGEKI